MILICGSEYKPDELPYNDELGYKVVPPDKQSNIQMCLKTIAPTPKCVTVYVREDFDNMVLHTLREKTVIFKDDEDLMKKVRGVPDEVDIDYFDDGILGTEAVTTGNIDMAEEVPTHTEVSATVEVPHVELSEAPVEAPRVSETPVTVHTEAPTPKLKVASLANRTKPAPVEPVVSEVVTNADSNEKGTAEADNFDNADFDASDFDNADFSADDFDNIDFDASDFDNADFDASDFDNSVVEEPVVEEPVVEEPIVEEPVIEKVSEEVAEEPIVEEVTEEPVVEEVDFEDATDFDDVADFDDIEEQTDEASTAVEAEEPVVETPIKAEPPVVEAEKPVVEEKHNTLRGTNLRSSLRQPVVKEESLFDEEDDDFTIPEEDITDEGYQQLLADKDNHIESLVAKIKLLEANSKAADYEKVSKTLAEIQHRLSEVEAEKAKIEEDCKKLEAEKVEAVAKLENVGADTEEVERLKAELGTAQTKIAEMEASYEMSQNTVKELKIKATDMEASYTMSQNTIKELKIKATETEMALSECQGKLKDTVPASDYNELQKQFNELSTKQADAVEVEELKSQLQSKENLINDLRFQKDSAFEELNTARREAEEDKTEYETMLRDLEDKVLELETAAANELVAPSDLGAYDGYTVKPRAYIRPTMQPAEELLFTAMDCSDVTIIAHGPMDSVSNNMKTLATNVIGKSGVLIVDMSFSICLPMFMKASPAPMDYTELSRDNYDISKLVNRLGNTSVLNITVSHDIAFLTMNWGNVIKNLKAYAQGNPIVILLPTIDSFPTLYTFLKLSAVANNIRALIISSAHPLCINQLKFRLSVAETTNFSIALIEAMSIAPDSVTKALGKYKFKLFAQGMEYEKLGLI